MPTGLYAGPHLLINRSYPCSSANGASPFGFMERALEHVTRTIGGRGADIASLIDVYKAIRQDKIARNWPDRVVGKL